MKILLSVSYYAPHISGLTNAIKNLAEALAKKGYTVTVLTTQHEKYLAKNQTIQNVVVIRVPYLFKISKGFVMPFFLISAYKAIKDADQVIITLPQFEGFLIALLAKLLHKKIHCLYVCEVVLKGNSVTYVIEFFLRLSNHISLSLADTVVTLTEDFAKHTPVLAKQRKKVYAILPIIRTPEVSSSAKARLLTKLPKKKYIIGFIGRFSHEKGIEYLLETIPLLQKKLGDSFLIVLAGPLGVGEGAYQQTLLTLLQKYHTSVVWLHELQDRELGAFYQLLDVLVLPSVTSTEAFGMVQVEAMLCGTPVVASDLPGVRVPITLTGMGDLARPNDTKDLAEKILRVVENKSIYRKRKKMVKRIFSPKKVIAQYNALLK